MSEHEDKNLLEKTVEARGREITECHAEIAALRAERDRLATDLGIRASLLEQVADGLVAPTRDAIQQRLDEMRATSEGP